MKKIIKSLACIGLITLTLVSCSSKETEEDVTSQSSAYFKTDNYGREVLLDEKPSKVLTLGPNCTELFAELGLEDYVIGRSLVNHSDGKFNEFTDAINNIPTLNYAEATREAILTSGADFIYAIDWEISDVGCNIDEVADYGMNVYVNSANTLEEQYKEIEDIGAIFGVEDRAKALVDDQKSRIDAVSEKVAEETPVKVLVYDSGNDGIFTCSGINFESLLISLAGGENIFNDITDKDWVTVSYEQVIDRDPDYIIVHDYDIPSADEKIAEIKANPVLKELDCVKNDRFITVSLQSVLPGNRMADTVEYFAKEFYPDKF